MPNNKFTVILNLLLRWILNFKIDFSACFASPSRTDEGWARQHHQWTSSTPQWMVRGYVPGTSVDYRTTADDLEHFLFDVTRCGLRSRDLDTEFPAKSRVLPRFPLVIVTLQIMSYSSRTFQSYFVFLWCHFILRTPNKDVFASENKLLSVSRL